jgi:hypothetical protein
VATAKAIIVEQADRVAAVCHSTFSDGTNYWRAAPNYVLAFVLDSWYAFTARPEYFAASEIDNLFRKIVDNAVGGDFPIALTENLANSVGDHTLFYSGADLPPHSYVTQDGNLLIPQYAKLYYDRTGDISTFTPRSAAIATALSRVPRDSTSKLIHITSGQEYVAWGFHDNQRPTGDYLMGSLIFWKSATDLAALFTVIGDSVNSALWAGRANEIIANIDTLWNATDGMFHCATGQNNQIDICGSAYAVFLGVASSAQKISISNWLVSQYFLKCADGLPFVFEGFWRQSDRGWDYRYLINGAIIDEPGSGDDGAWSVANEWIAEAMRITNPDAAVRMVVDFSMGHNMTREMHPLGGATGGFDDNLESPMGLAAFMRKNPVLFE